MNKKAALAPPAGLPGEAVFQAAAVLEDYIELTGDLLAAAGVPGECAELVAEGIEHHVFDVALDAFARFLKR